jgi:hypothetical protein
MAEESLLASGPGENRKAPHCSVCKDYFEEITSACYDKSVLSSGLYLNFDAPGEKIHESASKYRNCRLIYDVIGAVSSTVAIDFVYGTYYGTASKEPNPTLEKDALWDKKWTVELRSILKSGLWTSIEVNGKARESAESVPPARPCTLLPPCFIHIC